MQVLLDFVTLILRCTLAFFGSHREQAVDQRHDGGGVYRLSRGLSERAIHNI